MLDLGVVRPGSTIRIPFATFDKDDGSSITMTNFAVADILIYKDGGTTERASTSGFTATTDFDAKTGKHLAVIDLSDNTTAGFYNAGSEYLVGIDSVTVDAVTVGSWIARFRIGYAGAMFDTTIATLTNQTSFTLTTGPAEDDAINGCEVVIHDIASAVQCGKAIVADYTGSTKTVTLVAGTTFTVAAGDNISIMWAQPLQPSTIGRQLGVDSNGAASRVTLVDTLTTYTGNTPQTGDSFARIGATGSGLTSLAPASTALSTAQWTNTRAGYLDNINNANLANVPAFPTNFASLGINASGHISRVVLVDTLTTYTGNTPQTGDSFARIGATGSGLTSLAPSATALSTAQWTNARAGYLDNINNANLANVPAFPTNFAATLINSSGHISRVTLVDTLTTYTGNTPQTGDSFARIGATGSGLTSLAPASTALSTAQWTNTRAGYLDNINNANLANVPVFPTSFDTLNVAAINLLASHDPGGTIASSAGLTAAVFSLSSDIANVQDGTDWLKAYAESDEEIITGTTPWSMVNKVKGTSIVLKTKFLRSVAGADITSTTVVIGSAKES